MDVRINDSTDRANGVIIVEVDYWYGTQCLQLGPHTAKKLAKLLNQKIEELDQEVKA